MNVMFILYCIKFKICVLIFGFYVVGVLGDLYWRNVFIYFNKVG